MGRGLFPRGSPSTIWAHNNVNSNWLEVFLLCASYIVSVLILFITCKGVMSPINSRGDSLSLRARE